jgi:hypothetical protein
VDNLYYVSFCHSEVFHECEREEIDSYDLQTPVDTRGNDVNDVSLSFTKVVISPC